MNFYKILCISACLLTHGLYAAESAQGLELEQVVAFGTSLPEGSVEKLNHLITKVNPDNIDLFKQAIVKLTHLNSKCIVTRRARMKLLEKANNLTKKLRKNKTPIDQKLLELQITCIDFALAQDKFSTKILMIRQILQEKITQYEEETKLPAVFYTSLH